MATVMTLSVSEKRKGFFEAFKARHRNLSEGILSLIEREVRNNPEKYPKREEYPSDE